LLEKTFFYRDDSFTIVPVFLIRRRSAKMYRQCISCEYTFSSTGDLCPKCGSKRFISAPEPSAAVAVALNGRIPFSANLICFGLAALIEFFALLLYLGKAGMRHSPNAPMSNGEFLILILHLPTILLSWALGNLFAPFVPITQPIFWTYLFSGVWRRLAAKQP
jgi:hypothetical protein